jgi:hypothetical protein
VPEWLIALISAIAGAAATGVIGHLTWRVQRREIVQESEDRERRQQRARMTDRLQEVAEQLIELANLRQSPNTPVNIANEIESQRLRREFLSASTLALDLFSEDEESANDLNILRRTVSQATFPSLSEAQLTDMRARVNAICARLGQKTVSAER